MPDYYTLIVKQVLDTSTPEGEYLLAAQIEAASDDDVEPQVLETQPDAADGRADE